MGSARAADQSCVLLLFNAERKNNRNGPDSGMCHQVAVAADRLATLIGEGSDTEPNAAGRRSAVGKSGWQQPLIFHRTHRQMLRVGWYYSCQLAGSFRRRRGVAQ